MVHRYFAGALGLVILALAVQAIRRRGQPGQPLKLPLLLLAVVIAQAIFGMWTVTLQLWPQVVTAHLLGVHHAQPAVSAVPAAVRRACSLAGRGRSSAQIRRHRPARGGGADHLGGWVSSNYAAVACTDFPTCHGEWWPRMDFANAFNLTHHDIGPNYLGGLLYGEARTAIHVSHRIGALLVTLVLLLLAAMLMRRGLGRLAGLLIAALALQVGLGISNVVFNLPLAVAVAHNGGGAALLLVLVLVNYRLRQPAHATRQTEPASISNTTGQLDLPRA